MPCVNVIIADTDEEAEYLSTSMLQMFMGVVTGDRSPMKPPVDSMEGIWNEHTEYAVKQMLACSFIGSAESCKRKSDEFLDQTKADELMVSTYIFDHTQRVKSYELLADLMGV
jgi:alkanesulfonate monooxygenase SsuD/methylene tetrahydromethanopterin reductase-like flavin-dependent oxidoreductase (luciferase family)